MLCNFLTTYISQLQVLIHTLGNPSQASNGIQPQITRLIGRRLTNWAIPPPQYRYYSKRLYAQTKYYTNCLHHMFNFWTMSSYKNVEYWQWARHIVNSICLLMWQYRQRAIHMIACIKLRIIWYRVLPQGERQFLFAIRVGCVVVWPIFSTSNLVEYLVINSYSVTGLDNFRKETFDRAKKHQFLEVFNSLTFILGESPHLHGPPSWTKVWWRYHFDSLNYHIFFYHISTGKRAWRAL